VVSRETESSAAGAPALDSVSRLNGHRAGWLRVVLLGLGGGIIPCWDAVLLFLVALTRGRVGLAIPLLLAFSAGLAAVLIGLGIGVVYANRAGGRRFGERAWFQFLPVFSAALLVALGVWFVRDGWQFLVAAARP
jgi:ABC-type nickel/cobalt efflux system permease component RcnA